MLLGYFTRVILKPDPARGVKVKLKRRNNVVIATGIVIRL